MFEWHDNVVNCCLFILWSAAFTIEHQFHHDLRARICDFKVLNLPTAGYSWLKSSHLAVFTIGVTIHGDFLWSINDDMGGIRDSF